MNNEEYWKSRIDNIYDSNYHKNKLKKIYRKAFKDNERKILDLYDTLKDKGELSTTALYKFERFLSLQEELEKQTKEVNDSLYEQATKDLKKAYKDTFNETIDNIGSDLEWGIQNEKMLNKVLNKKWAGNNYSKRIWNNSKQLSEDIESAVVDCLTRGVSKDIYVKSIKNKYDVGFSKADRLVRTELMHTINEGQKDVYKAEGIKKVKWYAAEDERMCDVCGKMHDKEYDIDNVPSIAHANCRCTIIPIINTDLTSKNKYDNINVKLPDGSVSHITKGTNITDVEVFAGKGSNKELRVKNFLVQNYGGNADDWQHAKGRGYIDTPDGKRKAVLHWFEESSVGIKEMFVKGWSKK